MIYNNNQQFGRNGYGYYQQPQVQQMMYQQAISIKDMPIEATRFMNETEAKAYLLMPNHKELLIDREKSVAYLKATDSLGQSSCQVFKFEEIQENKPQEKLDVSNFLTKDTAKDFVTRKDFDELVKKINQWQNKGAVDGRKQ